MPRFLGGMSDVSSEAGAEAEVEVWSGGGSNVEDDGEDSAEEGGHDGVCEAG
jgi:hypothetical protein